LKRKSVSKQTFESTEEASFPKERTKDQMMSRNEAQNFQIFERDLTQSSLDAQSSGLDKKLRQATSQSKLSVKKGEQLEKGPLGPHKISIEQKLRGSMSKTQTGFVPPKQKKTITLTKVTKPSLKKVKLHLASDRYEKD
jgi:hypothetical protein